MARNRRCNLPRCSTFYNGRMRLYSSLVPDSQRITRKHCILLVGVALVLVVVYLTFFTPKEPDYYTCPFEPVKKKRYEKCLDGYLHGTSTNGGLGNVLFEFFTFLAIAKRTNRRPIISNYETISRIERILPDFPNFEVMFEKTTNTEGCDCFTEVIHFSTDCCRVDEGNITRVGSSNESTVRAHTFYTQGIQYLSFLQKSLVSHLLGGSDEVVYLAKEKLFPIDMGRYEKRNLCVHIRRGDFLTSPLVLESDELFTRKAIDYILLREGRNMDIYAFGNDRIFMEDTFHNWKNVSLAVEDKSLPPNVEFEFSRLYCDVTLLTASASTYGWWMGYLSRGQVVYYNANFSRPNGIDLQMDRQQFFPSSWTPLELVQIVRSTAQ